MTPMRADLLFHVLFLVAVVVLVMIWMDYRSRARRTIASVPRTVNEIEKEVRELCAVLGFVVILIHTFAPNWLAWTDVHVPLVIRAVAATLLVPATGLLIWAERSATPQPRTVLRERRSRRLVTTGAYRYARHPVYALGLVIGACLVLISANWVIALIVGVTTAHLVLVRLPREERELRTEFGDRFDSYARTTPRLVPRVGRRSRQAIQGCLVLFAAAGCRGDGSYNGRSATEWAVQLASDRAAARREAAHALRHIRPRSPDIVRALLVAEDDENPAVRAAAAAAVRQLDARAANALRSAAEDSLTVIRRRAVAALGTLPDRSPQSIQVLLRALDDGDDSVSFLAMWALAGVAVGHADAIERMRELAGKPGPRRPQALLVLPWIDVEPHSLLSFYRGALTDTSALVRAAALSNLPHAAGEEQDAVPELLKQALTDSMPTVQLAAMRSFALTNGRGLVAKRVIDSLSRRGVPEVRRIADSVLRAFPRDTPTMAFPRHPR
jgi:protein-S-isoprenylcysteine O-methyltransferase Ste14